MELYVGLDVSLDETSICVVNASGKVTWQGKCLSTPEAIAETLKAKAASAVRITLESGSLSTWHWHALHGMGLPVVCIDARHAKAALAMQINKTDKNDAQGLAQIARTGFYREVLVKGFDSHLMRCLLGTRIQLVRMRVDLVNQIKGILRTFGLIYRERISGSGQGGSFEEEVLGLVEGNEILKMTINALLQAWRNIGTQVCQISAQIRHMVHDSKACQNLITVPGIGELTAAAYLAAVDDPSRFAKSSSVGAYLGLTPRRYQSGTLDVTGKISKCGDKLLRSYLFEAAGVLLTRVQKWSTLKAWGVKLAKKVGFKKAKVAVARKLAVLMHKMLLTGEAFRWSTNPDQTPNTTPSSVKPA